MVLTPSSILQPPVFPRCDLLAHSVLMFLTNPGGKRTCKLQSLSEGVSSSSSSPAERVGLPSEPKIGLAFGQRTGRSLP
ncbi:hypothetical protein ACOMHN_036876 [Nucella lapillus]